MEVTARIRLKLLDPATVPLDVTANDTSLALTVDAGSGGIVPAYPGPYTVTPEAWFEQTLPTTGKRMTQDLTVDAVPYLLTSNESGGYTATIG